MSLGVTPLTSDHGAIVSTFDGRPRAMPAMVAVDAGLQTVGDTLAVSYNASGSNGSEVAIVAPQR